MTLVKSFVKQRTRQRERVPRHEPPGLPTPAAEPRNAWRWTGLKAGDGAGGDYPILAMIRGGQT
jgi:hypothetical protein